MRNACDVCINRGASESLLNDCTSHGIRQCHINNKITWKSNIIFLYGGVCVRGWGGGWRDIVKWCTKGALRTLSAGEIFFCVLLKKFIFAEGRHFI